MYGKVSGHAMFKHLNDVARQIETPGKARISAKFVARHDFHVNLEDTLYHDCERSRCCNGCIFSLTTCELLNMSDRTVLHSSGVL